MGEAAVVAVGHGDEFDAGNLEGGGGVALALDAGADERELDMVVCGSCRRLLRSRFSGRLEVVECGCRGSKAGVLQKSSAIKGHRLRSSVSARAARDGVPRTEVMAFRSQCKGACVWYVEEVSVRMPPTLAEFGLLLATYPFRLRAQSPVKANSNWPSF